MQEKEVIRENEIILQVIAIQKLHSNSIKYETIETKRACNSFTMLLYSGDYDVVRKNMC